MFTQDLELITITDGFCDCCTEVQMVMRVQQTAVFEFTTFVNGVFVGKPMAVILANRRATCEEQSSSNWS